MPWPKRTIILPASSRGLLRSYKLTKESVHRGGPSQTAWESQCLRVRPATKTGGLIGVGKGGSDCRKRPDTAKDRVPTPRLHEDVEVHPNQIEGRRDKPVSESKRSKIPSLGRSFQSQECEPGLGRSQLDWWQRYRVEKRSRASQPTKLGRVAANPNC